MHCVENAWYISLTVKDIRLEHAECDCENSVIEVCVLDNYLLSGVTVGDRETVLTRVENREGEAKRRW